VKEIDFVLTIKHKKIQIQTRCEKQTAQILKFPRYPHSLKGRPTPMLSILALVSPSGGWG
jgi:hypothetical protein